MRHGIRVLSNLKFKFQKFQEFQVKKKQYISSSFPKYELASTISKKIYCLGKIFSWSDSMFLKLNLSKFELIYFSKSSGLIESLSLNISGLSSESGNSSKEKTPC